MIPHAVARARAVRIAPGGTDLVLAAALSFSCALIHAQAAVDHFSESHLYAVLFCLVALGQAGWGVALLRGPSPALLGAGVVGLAGVVIAWVASRTVGLPLGPDTTGPEAAGLLDVVATLQELVVIALAGLVLSSRRPVRPVAVGLRALGLTLLLFSSLVLAAGTHAH